MRYIFARLEKSQFIEICEKIFENFETILSKLLKTHYFSRSFKKLTNYALIFCAFGRKRQFSENFEKFFENIDIFSSKTVKNALF